MKQEALKPIEEHSYTFMEGFLLGSTQPANKGGMRQIDWEMIESLLNDAEYKDIEVGLAEDWYCTSAKIKRDGVVGFEENDEAGFFGCSFWATPAVKLNGVLYECWKYGDQSFEPDWLEDAE
jgi:hypothetical protein